MKQLVISPSALVLTAFFVLTCYACIVEPSVGGGRKLCNTSSAGDDIPMKNRLDTSERLRQIRHKMQHDNIQGYIVPSTDAHLSPIVADRDRRLRFLTGFTGSAGYAVILATNESVLITDGRYEIQADEELDCSWQLVVSSRPVNAMISWIKKHAKQGSRVASDARLISQKNWLKLNEVLDSCGFRLIPQTSNIVDDVWKEGRPASSRSQLYIHDIKFAGKEWQVKVEEALAAIEKSNAKSLVVSALDEICWLFNLRGSDVPYTPLFKAYALIQDDNIRLYVSPEKVTANVSEHLRSINCTADNFPCVQIREYRLFYNELSTFARETQQSILVPDDTNFAVYAMVTETRRVTGPSPIAAAKAVKNAIEIQGMRDAHIRDAVAICELLAAITVDIEQQRVTGAEGLQQGLHHTHHEHAWDELSAAHALTAYRADRMYNRNESFKTISAVGANAAKAHYTPTAHSVRRIDSENIYLLDSGGQYLDGTTDVTRLFILANQQTYNVRFTREF